MSTTFARDLEGYNGFILQFQDRAYTFAVHLTGAGDLAESIVQEVFRGSFPLWQRAGYRDPGFGTRLLRDLLQRCRQAGPVLGPASLHKTLDVLSCDEKLALILVECLDCTAQEAVQILAWPPPRLRRTLASARLKISPGIQNYSQLENRTI